GAADVVLDVDAAHAERGRFPHHVDRKMLFLVPAERMRRDLLGGEFARHVANGDLVFVEREMHSGLLILAVIARSEATKQSSLPLRQDGLLRCARNDGVDYRISSSSGSRTPRPP